MEQSLNRDPRSMLTTPQLFHRKARPIDIWAEAVAMHEITRVVSDNPPDAIQRFLDVTLELCAAGTAGLSTLATNSEGERVFRWDALSGALAAHVGGTTPVDFSPCGLCLADGHTILIERPARIFTYFAGADPEIVEGLVVPLYDAGKVR